MSGRLSPPTIVESLESGTTCRDCRFFHPEMTSRHVVSDNCGECRRLPPGIDPDEPGMRIWPAVWSHDWCGAFEGCRSADPPMGRA